ncbi:hypothetical protein [Vibrio anguillarum]|uniref:hypothetical protein n=2 Tax=Vibrio anguillarum TaxID=55601 RepID=UPI0018FE942E|nr:hypothetical protein [Vibrio anguillarum]MBF4426005.1 hypothetical protein [Vibrio anguillarum]
MGQGRTVLRYVGGIKNGREKLVATVGRDSKQEYLSSYVSIENNSEVENKVVSTSWDDVLPYNWSRCTYDIYEKKQDPELGLIMQFIDSIERKRCQAITAKKLQCSHAVRIKGDFCNQHRK